MNMSMYVCVKRPNQGAFYSLIDNTLEALQKFVGGYIEIVPLARDLVAICNEEGRIYGLDHNCVISGIDFVGPILLCGTKGEELSDIPYSMDDMKRYFPELFKEGV